MLLTIEQRTEEAALVRAAQAGDRAAFGMLYEQFARMIHGIVLARVPYSDADDLVQDVFIRAMKQLPSLRETAAFPGWLASIARHAAMDHHRRLRPVAALVVSVLRWIVFREVPGRTAKRSKCWARYGACRRAIAKPSSCDW